jgi:hypothetical protein
MTNIEEVAPAAPLQADWIPKQWKTSKMLAAGFFTLGTTMNNIVESTWFKLMDRPNGKLSIRESGPPDVFETCASSCVNKVPLKDELCQYKLQLI